jgi:hypothetical protein
MWENESAVKLALFTDVTNERSSELMMKCLVMLTDTPETDWQILKNVDYNKLIYVFSGYMCDHYNKLYTVICK